MGKAAPQFAGKTSVEVDKTKSDIEKMLQRYGATAFGHIYDQQQEQMMFEIGGRRVRFAFPLLTLDDAPTNDASGRPLTRMNLPGGSREGWLQQAKRTRWRELHLLIKAKLVAVEAGITTIEDEFLAHIVLPNNQTVGQWTAPYLRNAYIEGRMPPLLPGGEGENG